MGSGVRCRLVGIFGFVFSAAFFALWVSLTFFNNATVPVGVLLPLAIAAGLGGALLLGGVALLARAGRQGLALALKNHPGRALCAGLLALLALQLVFLPAISTDIGWDPAAAMGAAQAADPTAYSWYFSAYPNNLFLLFFYRAALVLFTVLRVGNIWLGLSIINALAVDVAILLCCVAALWWFGRAAMGCTFVLGALLLGLSPWLMVPYSDTLATPFVAGVVFCFALLGRAKDWPRRALCGTGLGLCAAVGYLVKPTALIVAVAAVLCVVFTQNRQGLKCALLPAAAALVAGLCAVGAFNLFVSRQGVIYIEEGRSVPAVAFYMMGLSQQDVGERTMYGAWNEADAGLVLAQDNTAAMRAVSRQHIGQRLAERGFLGTLGFYANKARWVTSEGAFFWALEGRFAGFEEPVNLWQSLVYPGGGGYNGYSNWAQGVWVLALLALALPLWQNTPQGRTGRLLLRLSFFGVVLFTVLFEGRSRYLISYLPLAAMLGGGTLSAAAQKIQKALFAGGTKA